MESSSSIPVSFDPSAEITRRFLALVLPHLTWIIFGIVLLGFCIMSLIFLYHWRVHGRGVFVFFIASVTYFVVSAILIWGAFTFLALAS
ncbi:MAG: hypothetical protein WCO03_01875 [bacterium]